MLKIIPSMEVPPFDPLAAEGLLGAFLPEPPGLVLLSGETSAGKTVFVYNTAYHIAEGTEFIGLTPTSALRVLYIDLESPEQVHRRLVGDIGRSENLAYVREMPHNLGTHQGREDLQNAIREWRAGVVVIDPLMVAWPCRDENDNAEAGEQMWRLKEIAVAESALIVVIWNMGEAYVKDKFKPRGATARVDRADLALNYTESSATTRLLKIVKSRYDGIGKSITLQFAGDHGFKAVEALDISPPSQTQVIQAHLVTLVLERPQSRQELLAALRQKGFTNENLVDKALADLCTTGKLARLGRGMYGLPGSGSE